MKVFGQVQGVSFRYYTVQKARELGFTGYVRNLPDGTVEVVAEGEESALRELLAWFQQEGPPAARVEEIQTQWGSGKGGFDRFEVRE